MTKNQIEYMKLRETQRANLAQEGLTRLRDVRSYEIGLGTLAESQRHNVATEEQAKLSLDETTRHNIAGEENTKASIAESVRHNKAAEEEMRRHNIVGEQYNERSLREAARHNVNQESIGRSQVGATYANINLGYSQLGETTRSNLAREAETNRSNVAREGETTRHNTRSESIDMYRNRTDASYKTGQLKQGERKLKLDAWKVGVDTADTILKGAKYLVPLIK